MLSPDAEIRSGIGATAARESKRLGSALARRAEERVDGRDGLLRGHHRRNRPRGPLVVSQEVLIDFGNVK